MSRPIEVYPGGGTIYGYIKEKRGQTAEGGGEKYWMITLDGEVLYYDAALSYTGDILLPGSFTPKDINQWLEEKLKEGAKIRLLLPPQKVSWGFRWARDYQIVAEVVERRRDVKESKGWP